MRQTRRGTYYILAALEPVASGLISSTIMQNESSGVNQTSMTDSHSLVHLSDSLHDMMIPRTILSDLTPFMADSYASNSKHKIS